MWPLFESAYSGGLDVKSDFYFSQNLSYVCNDPYMYCMTLLSQARGVLPQKSDGHLFWYQAFSTFFPQTQSGKHISMDKYVFLLL